MSATEASIITSPAELAALAKRAESGYEDSLLLLGQALPTIAYWDRPACLAFAKALDAKLIAFLRREFGPLIDRHAHLAVLLRQTEAVRAELTSQNLRRWDKSAGRDV